jgi:hypothetical protein
LAKGMNVPIIKAGDSEEAVKRWRERLIPYLKYLESQIGEGGGGSPDPHASSHENSGSDEINLAGLGGEPSALVSHKSLSEVHHSRYTDAEAALIAAVTQDGLHLWDINKNQSRLVGLDGSNNPVMPDCECQWWFDIAATETIYWDDVNYQIVIS